MTSDKFREKLRQLARRAEVKDKSRQRDADACEHERQTFLAAYRDLGENLILLTLEKSAAEEGALRACEELNTVADEPILAISVERGCAAFPSYALRFSDGSIRFSAHPRRRRVIMTIEIGDRYAGEAAHFIHEIDEDFVFSAVMDFLRRSLGDCAPLD